MVNPYCSTIFFKKGLLCENLLYTITYFRTLHGFIVLRGRGPQYGTLLEYPLMFTLPHLSIPVNQTIKFYMKQQHEQLLLCKNLLFSLLIVNFCNIECVQWLLHTGGSKFMIMLAVYLKNVMMLLAVYWENNSWITLLSGSTPGSWSCKQCEAETRTASLLEFRINCAICCALIVNFLCMSQYRLYW